MAFIGILSFFSFMFFLAMTIVPPLRRKLLPKVTMKGSVLFCLISFIVLVGAMSSDAPENISTPTTVDATNIDDKSETKAEPTAELTNKETTPEATKEKLAPNVESATDSNPTPETTIESTPEPKETAGQRNATRSAINYLNVMAFSREGLIDQLEFDGYSTEDAEYAVDQSGADWNEQAVKSAKTYLDVMSFSKQGLKEQLEFDGYTSSQAEYGVNKVYQ